MRYNGERKIPEGFNEREKEEIEAMIRELEHQFAFVEEFGENALKIWKRINEERGFKKGKYLIDKYGIKGMDIDAADILCNLKVAGSPPP